MVLSDTEKKENRYLISTFSFFRLNKKYAVTMTIIQGMKKWSILNQVWKNIAFNVKNCKTSITKLKLKSIRDVLNAWVNTIKMLFFMYLRL